MKECGYVSGLFRFFPRRGLADKFLREAGKEPAEMASWELPSAATEKLTGAYDPSTVKRIEPIAHIS